MEMIEILHLTPVIPVVTIDKAEYALPLARALLAGGINVMEITLRTPEALEAIKMINQSLSSAMVTGAGTLLEPQQFAAAKAAGARFGVSPGLTPELAKAAKEIGLPYLPATITPSEMLQARQMGFHALKFFPAQASNGLAMLKSLAPVFPDIQFCPTGGISVETMHDYLALKNVVAVGGTWIAAPHLIEQKAWDTITSLAKQTRM
ncbi:MAG: bifunctional 4-hydroxy-2-oxoglutarate aldolase/2-dehydro-3-deoxy-phosphogluconate aldolase [Gammaproteobacteria bacterium]